LPKQPKLPKTPKRKTGSNSSEAVGPGNVRPASVAKPAKAVGLDEWTWTVGEVAGVFGIKGELKVRLETDFPNRFAGLKQVCLRPAVGAPRLMDIQTARLHKGQVLLKLQSVDSIEDAQRLRGAKVQLPRAQAVELPENSYYAVDIVGMDVVTRDGKLLGTLDKVLPYPAHDLFQVGAALIPAVKEIVLEVDTVNRRIVVDPPAGLLPNDEPETVE
jgi:16S rRNA processing protein RimM